MATYVIRAGKLVLKYAPVDDHFRRSAFPSPRLSRMEPYASPIDGKEVTSWSQRERELRDNDCYDPRDVSKPYPKSAGRKKNLK